MILAALSFAVAVLVLLFARDPAPVTLHASSLLGGPPSAAAAGAGVHNAKASTPSREGGAVGESQRLIGGEEGDIGLADVSAGDNDAVHGLRSKEYVLGRNSDI